MDEVKAKKCSFAFAYGMERDFNAWLVSLGAAAPVKSLTELRRWNSAHQKGGALKDGQSFLDLSDAMDLDTYRARYQADRARDVFLAATHGIDEAMAANRLDALLFPGHFGANVAARPGYPTVIVGFGMILNEPSVPFPSVRRELRRHGVQRADLAQARLRVRAGRPAARPAARSALIH